MPLTPGQILAILSGGAALGGTLLKGSDQSPEQERLSGYQADTAQINRDLLQSRAKNEQANMPAVMKSIFEAVSNQMSRPRSQILGPNFQPRLSGTRGTPLAPPTWTPYTGTTYGAPTQAEIDAWHLRNTGGPTPVRPAPMGTPKEEPETPAPVGFEYIYADDGTLLRGPDGELLLSQVMPRKVRR